MTFQKQMKLVNPACICRFSFYTEYGGLKFMFAPNGKDLANNYLERKSLSIGWISISPAFLDEHC